MSDVETKILKVISERTRNLGREVQLSDTLDSLGLESLDVLEIAFELEQEFGIDIPFNANSKLEYDTVGALVTAVEGLIAEKTGKQ
jgi:acyl carrier protein